MNRAIEENTVSTTSSMGGTVVTKSKGYEEAVASAQRVIEHLKTENADLIVAYNLLYRETDQGLQEVINTAKSAIAAQNRISEMMTSRNEVATQIENQATSVAQSTAKLREERIALEQEQQALLGAVNYKHPTIGGAQLSAYNAPPNPTANLPKSIAMLDESTLPAISFGSNEQTEEFTSNIDAMTEGAGHLLSVLTQVGNVLNSDTEEAKSFGQVALELATTLIPAILSMVAGPAAGAFTSSLFGTLSSIVPFAEGGIVTSATLGVFGEAGPEAVMPLDRLNDFVRDREVRVTGTIVGQGKDLSVIIDNYNRVRNVKS